MTFTYPSAQFPGEPGVTLRAGDGWVAVEAPGTRLAIARESGAGQFRPNVAVIVARHSAGYPAEEVMVALEEVARGLEDARLETPFDVTVDGRQFVGRVLVYRHPQAGTIAELHMATSVESAGVTDVVQLVGTCAGDRVKEDLPLLRDVLSSVRIEPAPEPSA